MSSLTISKKLWGLVICSSVSIVLIGTFALYQLYQVDEASKEIRTNWMPSIQFLTAANAELANHRMKTYKHVTLTELDKMKMEEDAMKAQILETKINLDNYRKLAFSDFEMEKVQIVEEHILKYLDENNTIINLSRQNLYDSARNMIYSSSFKEYTELTQTIKLLIKFNIEQSQLVSSKSESIFKWAVLTISLCLFSFIVLTSLFGQTIINGIKTQLIYLQEVLKKLATGNVNVVLATNSNDEIGEVSKSLEEVVRNLKTAAAFSQSIGDGNLNTTAVVLSNDDVLGISLTNMQEKLKRVSEEDKLRNWAAEGMAKVGEILRSQTDNEQQLFDRLIKFIVNYSDSIQGGLFLASDKDDQTIHLAACYAYDRKKHIQKTILVGEGLVGQVYLEKMTCYLLDVPNNYVTITSGLGDSNPSAILIVPMKIEEMVIGIIELASFKAMQKHQIEFVEKLADSVASAIASVRTNEKTKQLLQTTLQQTEELRAQEEEVRQNLEEMNATQEEMNRKSQEYQNRFNVIGNSHIGTVEFDLRGLVLDANKEFLTMMGYHSIDEVMGKHHRIFLDTEYASSISYSEFWSDLMSGVKRKGIVSRIRKDGTKVDIHSTYELIRDSEGVPIRVMKVAIDLTKFQTQSTS
jgi:PAS domain S-box-containing protein